MVATLEEMPLGTKLSKWLPGGGAKPASVGCQEADRGTYANLHIRVRQSDRFEVGVPLPAA